MHHGQNQTNCMNTCLLSDQISHLTDQIDKPIQVVDPDEDKPGNTLIVSYCIDLDAEAFRKISLVSISWQPRLSDGFSAETTWNLLAEQKSQRKNHYY